jgi:hypothetical protein
MNPHTASETWPRDVVFLQDEGEPALPDDYTEQADNAWAYGHNRMWRFIIIYVAGIVLAVAAVLLMRGAM